MRCSRCSDRPIDSRSQRATATSCWLNDERTAATDASREAAADFLRKRASLGWTDLDGAFGAAFERAKPGSTVIYVGDGIPTTGDADAQAAATRLRARGEKAGVVCHAVATSNTYEKPVLDAIASIGGGSRREVTDDPGGSRR